MNKENSIAAAPAAESAQDERELPYGPPTYGPARSSAIPPACCYCDQEIDTREPYMWLSSGTRAAHKLCMQKVKPTQAKTPLTDEIFPKRTIGYATSYPVNELRNEFAKLESRLRALDDVKASDGTVYCGKCRRKLG